MLTIQTGSNSFPPFYLALEKIILKRTNRKLRKKYKGRILKTTKPEARQNMIENNELQVEENHPRSALNE